MTLGTHHPPRCRAHNRRGEPCGLYPIHGGTVCQVHGGRAPQVVAAAKRRIADLHQNAIAALQHLVDDPDADRRAAAMAAKIIAEYAEGRPVQAVVGKFEGSLTLRIDRGDDTE